MVNLLELIYVLTAGSFLAAIFLYARGKPGAARRAAMVCVFSGVVAGAMYWHLGS